MSRYQARRRQAGFTLVELMVSLVLFTFAVAGVLSVAVSMTRGYREQRQAITTEGAVRAAMDFLADAVRQASPGLLSGATTDLTQASGTCPNVALSVVDSTTGPDAFTVVYANGAVVTTTRAPWTDTTTSLVVASADNFVAGDSLLLTDGVTGHLLKITGVNAVTDTLTLDLRAGCMAANVPASYVVGTLAIRAMRATFYVGTFDGQAALMMDPGADGVDPEPLAENIEDMQVAIGVDADIPIDGVQTDEWAFSNGLGALAGSVRALRIKLVSRTESPLQGGSPAFRLPPSENRTGLSPLDGFRRRVLTSVVDIRNLGGSPQ